MIVWCRCGVIHGGWTGAVAVAFSGAASGVGALAAPRRASGAWRAEPRPRPRPPHPMATRQDTAPARGGVAESHWPASPRPRFSYYDFQSLSRPVPLSAHTVTLLRTTHCFSHCRPVPTAHTVTSLPLGSTPGLGSRALLRDSAARAIEATLKFLLHGMLLRHGAQPPRLGDASTAPVLRGLRMHQMRPGGTSRAVHAMTQLDTIRRERAQNDGVVLVRREDDLHPCQAPQSTKEERL